MKALKRTLFATFIMALFCFFVAIIFILFATEGNIPTIENEL